MANLWKTAVVLTGDASGAITAVEATVKKVDELDKSVKKTKGSLTEKAATVAKWGAAAAAAAAGGIAAMVKGQIDAADAARDAAAATGITVEAFTGLEHAANLSGISSEQLTGSLNKFNKTISEAAKGSANQARAFADIGISVNDANGKLKNADALLLEVAGKFSQYEDGAAKAALAQELFGRSGAAMIPLLNEGADGIAAMTAEAERLGLVVSAETAAAADQFNDSLATLGAVGSGVGKKLMAEMLPAMNDITGLMLDYATNSDIAGTASKVLGTAMKVLATIGITIGAVFTETGERLGAMAAALMAAAKGDFSGAWTIIKGSATDSVGTMEKAYDRITKLWSGEFAEAGEQASEVTKNLAEDKKELTRTTKDAIDGEKEHAKALEKTEKALEKYFEREAKLGEERAEIVGDLEQEISALERQVAVVGLGETAQTALNRQLAIENALRSESYQKLLPSQRDGYIEMIAKQYDLNVALDQGTIAQDKIADAAKAAAEETARVWEEATDRINEVVADGWTRTWESLFSGTKLQFDDLADSLKQGFYRLLGELSHMAITRPIMLAITGQTGATGGFDLTSLLSSGKSIWSGITGLFGGGAAAGVDSLMINAGTRAAGGAITNTGAGAMNAGAGAAGGMGSMAAAGGWALLLVGIMRTFDDLKNGMYEISDVISGNNLNIKYGDKFGGLGQLLFPSSDIIDPLGINEKLFGFLDNVNGDGVKRASLGVSTNADWSGENTVQAASGLALTAYQKRVGEEGEAFAKEMQTLFFATDAALTGFFTSLGVTVDLAGQTLDGKASQFGEAVDGFFGAAGYNGIDPQDLVGATDEFVHAWVDRVNELTKAGIDLAPIYALQQEGELLADVLVRVHSQFAPVNAALESLGWATYEFGVQGMAALDGLVTATGGLENFVALTGQYYQLFYSEEERLAATSAQLNAVFADLNVTAPTTVEGFRALVTEYGNMGAEGQATLAALLGIAPAFHQVATAAAAAADTITDVVEDLLSVGQLNTLADISGTILASYQNREATLADLNEQLGKINTEITDLTTGLVESVDPVADTINTITDSVDSLAFSSSNLRSVADGIRSTIANLNLGATTYLTNKEQLDFAASQLAAAKQSYAQDKDPSGIASAASAYASELAQYYAGGPEGRALFDDLLSYLNSVGVELDVQASAAEKAERQRAAQQAALNSIEGIATRTLTDQQTNARLDLLLQERQNLELQIANLGAIDGRAIMEAQLQSLIDSTTGINTMADLLANLPGEIAAGLAGVIGTAIADYGGAVNADGSSAVVDRLFAQALGRMPSATEDGYWEAYAGNSTTAALVDAFYTQMIDALGVSPGLTQEQFMASYPQFADGGTHSGGWRVVGERGPELEYTGPSQIMSNNSSRALFDDSRIVRELGEMRKENAALRASIAKMERNQIDIARDEGKQRKAQMDIAAAMPQDLAKALVPVKP